MQKTSTKMMKKKMNQYMQCSNQIGLIFMLVTISAMKEWKMISNMMMAEKSMTGEVPPFNSLKTVVQRNGWMIASKNMSKPGQKIEACFYHRCAH